MNPSIARKDNQRRKKVGRRVIRKVRDQEGKKKNRERAGIFRFASTELCASGTLVPASGAPALLALGGTHAPCPLSS